MLHSQILALHWRPGVVTSLIVTVAFAYAPRRPRPEDRTTDGWGLLPRWRFSRGRRGQHSRRFDLTTTTNAFLFCFSTANSLSSSLPSDADTTNDSVDDVGPWTWRHEKEIEGWFRLVAIDGVDYKFVTYLPTDVSPRSCCRLIASYQHRVLPGVVRLCYLFYLAFFEQDQWRVVVFVLYNYLVLKYLNNR